jgi:hypothetical protein
MGLPENSAWVISSALMEPPASQPAMANTARAHVTEVDAPHLSMVSDPGTVTNAILRAVRATS